MFNSSPSIVFKVIYGNEETEIITYRGEYRNLMVLLYDRLFPDGFGECGGVGRCGTCLIEIIHGNERLSKPERNEETTLLKRGKNHANTRLACQLLVDESLNHALVVLCDE